MIYEKHFNLITRIYYRCQAGRSHNKDCIGSSQEINWAEVLIILGKNKVLLVDFTEAPDLTAFQTCFAINTVFFYESWDQLMDILRFVQTEKNRTTRFLVEIYNWEYVTENILHFIKKNLGTIR